MKLVQSLTKLLGILVLIAIGNNAYSGGIAFTDVICEGTCVVLDDQGNLEAFKVVEGQFKSDFTAIYTSAVSPGSYFAVSLESTGAYVNGSPYYPPGTTPLQRDALISARAAADRSKAAMASAMAIIHQALAAANRADATNLTSRATAKYDEAMRELKYSKEAYEDYVNKGGVNDGNISWERSGLDSVLRDGATFIMYKDIVPKMKMSGSTDVTDFLLQNADAINAIEQASGFAPLFAPVDLCGMTAGMTDCP